MDVFLIKEFVRYRIKQRVEGEFKGFAMSVNIAIIAFAVAAGLYASYLSWHANTLSGTGLPLKLTFALLAFVFGLTYLIIYSILRIKEKTMNTSEMVQIALPGPATPPYQDSVPKPLPVTTPVATPFTTPVATQTQPELQSSATPEAFTNTKGIDLTLDDKPVKGGTKSKSRKHR